MKSHVIILAGGKGTRMKSMGQKVLSLLAGKPIISHLLYQMTQICKKPTLVIGHGGEEVIRETQNQYHYVLQAERLGTGHAVLCTKPELESQNHEDVVVVPGDAPLVSAETVRALIELRRSRNGAVALAAVQVPDYKEEHHGFLHFGRIVRNGDGSVLKIVEYKDASEEERKIPEVNAGVYCFHGPWLWEHIHKLNQLNKQGEYYLTDLIHIARDEGKIVLATALKNHYEGIGVNTKEQLELLEKYITERKSL